jgi:hypothetical protein
MQQLFTTTLSKSTIKMVNACRMHVQVHSLAEITNHQGTSILACALYGIQDENNLPRLWEHSTSTIQWPVQSRPPTKAWKAWKYYLFQLLNKSKKLLTPLGPWNQHVHSRGLWIFMTRNNNIIRWQELVFTLFSQISTRTTNLLQFHIETNIQYVPTSPNLPFKPTKIEERVITVSKLY